MGGLEVSCGDSILSFPAYIAFLLLNKKHSAIFLFYIFLYSLYWGWRFKYDEGCLMMGRAPAFIEIAYLRVGNTIDVGISQECQM